MLKVLFFDFNGVIVNDEPLHWQLIKKTLASVDLHLNAQDHFTDYLGRSDADTFTEILKAQKIAATKSLVEKLVALKSSYYCQSVQAQDLFLPGVLDCIKAASERFQLAIVSGALRQEILAWLDKADIRGYFQTIISIEDVNNGKPNPEGYLLALKQINQKSPDDHIQSFECLVIEDSLQGIKAAHAAGIKCAALTSSLNKEQLAEAELVFDSFLDISLEMLEALS